MNVTTRLGTAMLAAVPLVILLGCAHAAPPGPALTRDLEREALEEVVRWRAPDYQVVMLLANEYLAARRDAEGAAYFCERARSAPERALFTALCGMFEVRLAPGVSLYRRVGWVEGALAKLDGAAASDGLSRYLRGLVAAELPGRFGRAQQAVGDLEWMLANEARFPPGLRRGAHHGLAAAYAALGRADAARAALARAGGPSEPGAPLLLTGFSVGARDGFRFTVPRLAEAAPGVYVARGYDFADISFVVTAEGSSPSTQGPRRHTRARRWRRWRRCAR